MPRKFLGQRINAGTDFVRPASLNLSEFDLDQIPDVPHGHSLETNELENYSTADVRYRRLSRPFGGTLRLKKRLSSVPELLLRDLGRLEQKTGIKLAQNSDTVSDRPIRRSAPPALTPRWAKYQRDKNPTTPTRRRPTSSPSNYRSYKPSPLAGPPSMGRGQALEAFPVTAVQIQFTPGRPSHTREKSDGELLFEEIIKAYANAPEREVPEPLALKAEMQNSLSKHFVQDITPRTFKQAKKQPLDFHGTIVKEEGIDDGEESKRPQRLSPPSLPAALEAAIPSVEYSASSSSDPSSSGEEFSDLGSIVESLKASPRGARSSDEEENYFSADDHLSSPKRADLPTAGRTRYSLRQVRASQITPVVLEFDELVSASEEEVEAESDDAISQLQEELDDLGIMDASSSIYNS
ncbi:LAQU0S01e04852g1_1 [Lachancea quebecensis]|uniref:LAQU0S01e04852g1_1 n=1 Tax=Lachancea quebecensis TaxID=1654605 RepID=A0A0P1KLT0_9SACH|nr:LAQU0S01e04852g1_1 [Lachancea quebecensis]